MQVLFPTVGRREPILGVVGPLQLEVVEVRLKQEYNVDAVVDSMSYTSARWLSGPADKVAALHERQRHAAGIRSPRTAGDAVRIRMGA